MKTIKETEIMIWNQIMKSKSRTIRNQNREIDDELSFLRNVKRKSRGNRWKSVGKPKKKKKNQRWNFRVCDLYLIEAEKHNAKRDEGSVWIELIFVETENTVAK